MICLKWKEGGGSLSSSSLNFHSIGSSVASVFHQKRKEGRKGVGLCSQRSFHCQSLFVRIKEGEYLCTLIYNTSYVLMLRLDIHNSNSHLTVPS